MKKIDGHLSVKRGDVRESAWYALERDFDKVRLSYHNVQIQK